MASILDGISKKPAVVVIAILMTTAALGGVYLLAGNRMEASEETFMPENEVVEASREIGRLFTTTELVQVLVKAKQGDVLAPDCLLEMLHAEKELAENHSVSSLLLDEGNPMRMSSVAEMVIQAGRLLDTIDRMAQSIGPQFNRIGDSLSQASDAIEFCAEGIRNALGTPLLPQAVIAANRTILALSMELGRSADLENLGGALGGFGAMPIQSFDEKIEFVRNLTRDDLAAILSAVMAYDGSATDDMVASVRRAVAAADEMLSAIDGLNQTLILASGDASIKEDSRAQTALATMRFLVPLINVGVSQFQRTARGLNIEKVQRQLDSGIGSLGSSIRLVLSRDFSPDKGIYAAKAALLLVGFNATLARRTEPGGALGGSVGGTGGEGSSMLRIQQAMAQILEKSGLNSTSMAVIGMDITTQRVLDATRESFKILLPAAFLLVLVILALVYRNIADMFFSLLALGFAVVWTYGLGTLAGFVFNPMTIAVPVVIVGLGIDYGIHLTLRYREERSLGKAPPNSAATSVSRVGGALLIATLTSLVAFMSNMTSQMSALRDFGILLSIGLCSAFLIMVAFVPSCQQILDLRSAKPVQRRGRRQDTKARSGTTRLLGAGAAIAQHRQRLVVVATLLITVGALVAASRLQARFELADFLPTKLEYAKDVRFVLDEFNATGATADVLIQGNVSSPLVLKAIEQSTLNMMDNEFVAIKATTAGDRPDVSSILSLIIDVASDESLTNPLDLYHDDFAQLFRSSLIDDDEVPDREVEALLAWLYQSNLTSARTRELLHRGPGGGFDSAVIRIGITTKKVEDADRLLAEITQDIGPLQQCVDSGKLRRATVTGSTIMIRQITKSLLDSLTTSFVLTLVLCLVMLSVVFYFTEKSLALGAITTAPVLLSSAWILGSMYLLGIPYTVLTVMVTSFTVGLGVTYAIHLTRRFIEEIGKRERIDEACREAVVHTGSALFGAAATTVAGFGLLVFSLLPPMQEFGQIVALTITYSFLSSVFVLPTFLVIWAKSTTKQRSQGQARIPSAHNG